MLQYMPPSTLYPSTWSMSKYLSKFQQWARPWWCSSEEQHLNNRKQRELQLQLTGITPMHPGPNGWSFCHKLLSEAKRSRESWGNHTSQTQLFNLTSGKRENLDIGIFVKETNKSLNKMKQKINAAKQTLILANLRSDSPDLKDIGLV